MEEQYGTIEFSIFSVLLCPDIIPESARRRNENPCALSCSHAGFSNFVNLGGTGCSLAHLKVVF